MTRRCSPPEAPELQVGLDQRLVQPLDGIARRLEVDVGRLQLLVRRPQLLVGRLELLVGRLQFLVARLELLVARLELLVARHQLLVGRLQLLVRGLELLVHLAETLAQLRRAADVVEDDARRRPPAAARRAAAEPGPRCRAPAVGRLVTGRPPGRDEPSTIACWAWPSRSSGRDATRELAQRPTHVMGIDAEELTRRIVGPRHERSTSTSSSATGLRPAQSAWRAAEPAASSGSARRREVERAPLGALGEVGGSAAGGAAWRRRSGACRLAGVKCPVPPPQHHLGSPEEEVAAFTQRVVQAREDVGLGLRVEVHQGVAAGDEIDAGDGRITGQVVATEDHATAQGGDDHVALVVDVGLEVELPVRLGDVVRAPCRGRRRRGPSRARRDRCPWRRSSRAAPSRNTQEVGHGHGQRVRLLAGGAPGAPDADGLVRPPARDDLREHSDSRNAQAAGSRKNPVKLIRIVLNRAVNSSTSASSRSWYAADRLEPDVLHAPPHRRTMVERL